MSGERVRAIDLVPVDAGEGEPLDCKSPAMGFVSRWKMAVRELHPKAALTVSR